MNRTAFILTTAVFAASCASTSTSEPPGITAVAKLQSTNGNTASGTATFVQRGDTVYVTANVTGLKPNADHGFHVHEKGDCSSGDGMSTGGHFNPQPEDILRDDRRSAPLERELWPWLVAAALALFVADVAAKRWPDNHTLAPTHRAPSKKRSSAQPAPVSKP